MKLNFPPVPGRKSQGRCAPGAAGLYAGAVLAAITLGETPTLAEICGGVLVLAGIKAVERRA